MIQAVQAALYDKGKVIPLHINIESAGSGTKIKMEYMTPTGNFSPPDTVKSQFCQTITAAEGASTATTVAANNTSNNNSAATTSGTAATSTTTVPAASETSTQPSGMHLSEPQKKILKAQLALKSKDNLLKTMIAEAKPTMEKVLEMQACFYPRLSYGLYQVNGGGFNIPSEGGRFAHHNMLECVNVQRVKDWKMIAKNAFQFKVVYVAEDSGESTQMTYEMQKQPDGVWLFNLNLPF